MPKRCLICTISGKVQGVWYRANTKKQAVKLGITGWVRNLPDGRVEALICGDDPALKTMQAWLAKGPPFAKVDQVSIEAVEETAPTNFKIHEV